MNLTALLGKLEERETKLKWLTHNVQGDMKKKSIALKLINVKDKVSKDDDRQSESDDDVNLIF